MIPFFRIKIIILCIFISTNLFAYTPGQDTWDDFKGTLNLMWKGSYLQFVQRSNIAYGVLAVGSHIYAFENDKKLFNTFSKKGIDGWQDLIGEGGTFLAFPIIPFAAYYLSRSKGKYASEKIVRISMEYLATMYIALAESSIISFIHVHDRPSTEGLNVWEKAFRQDSSYPSGHVIAYAAAFFKVMQFYGPYWSLLPAGLTLVAAFHRLQQKRHYFSDVLGGIFLTAFASEGVRAAGNYKDNHPTYKWIFEHEAKVGVLRNPKTGSIVGPRFTFSY